MADQKVTIVLDSSGNVQVGTNVSQRGQETVKWENRTGLDGVTIEFQDSPFDQPTFGPMKNKGSENSGKVRTNAQPGTYKYTVKLAGKSDLDPNVVVDR